MAVRRSLASIATTLAAVLALALASSALAQAPGAPGPRPPLVPCTEGATGPCVQVATSVEDIVGVWKQYLGNPMLEAPNRMGFIRYRQDGTYSLAPTADDTAAPFGRYPRGTITFDGEVATIQVEGDAVPPECRTATVQIQVYRHGQDPVAMFYTPIQDDCPGRRADLAMPLVWVAR